MKSRWMQMIIFFLLMGAMTVPAFAFDSGSTGALGAFNPTVNITVDLPEDGILNYTTINIPTGVTVTFTKNTTNTPVYMLATGNVTITGTISVTATAANTITPGKGGPGGFDGGIGASPDTSGGIGIGPGGGKTGVTDYHGYGSGGGGGGFGVEGYIGGRDASNSVNGGLGGTTYGNASISALIGGSGGGSGYGVGGTGGGGGGGGGAILIASPGTISITGTITANGGNGGAAGANSGKGGGGSGGAIKLMADVISGEGTLSAAGGSGSAASGGTNSSKGGNGGYGRIRLEAQTIVRTSGTTPAYTYSSTPAYVFPQNLPVLAISSIGSVAAPAAPSGQYSSPDVVLPVGAANPINITVQASNIPVGTTVTLTVQPQVGNLSSGTVALSGTNESSTATKSFTLSTQYSSVVTATATFTLLASNDMPIFAGGERVVEMQVASVFGGSSSITYITESGKRIPADI